MAEALMTYGVPGPEGATGATGARGPAGPTGPAGPSGIKAYFPSLTSTSIPLSYSGTTNAVLIGHMERRSNTFYDATKLILPGRIFQFVYDTDANTTLTVTNSGWTLSKTSGVRWILVL